MPYDPASDDDAPPPLRSERLVAGSEPKVLRSVTPPNNSAEHRDPAPDEVEPGKSSPAPDPAADGELESGEAILERFASLKERLGGGISEAGDRPMPISGPKPAAAPPPSAAVTGRSRLVGEESLPVTRQTPAPVPAPAEDLSAAAHPEAPPAEELLTAGDAESPTPPEVPPVRSAEGDRGPAATAGSPSMEPLVAGSTPTESEDVDESEPNAGGLGARMAEARRVRAEEKLRQELAAREELEDPEALEEFAPNDELDRLGVIEDRKARRAARKEERRKKRHRRSFWKELPILILVALVVAIIIKTFFFQAFYIPSGSMIPTLEVNDRVLVNKLSYRFGDIERGDILVFDSPEAVERERSTATRVLRSVGEATGLMSPDTVLIKRVIGLPGETIEIFDNQVFVDGNPIAEPYVPAGTVTREMEAFTVPPDYVFMMGDNRTASRDSRFFGPIHKDDVVGRAFVTVWPPGRWGGL